MFAGLHLRVPLQRLAQAALKLCSLTQIQGPEIVRLIIVWGTAQYRTRARRVTLLKRDIG